MISCSDKWPREVDAKVMIMNNNFELNIFVVENMLLLGGRGEC